MYAARIQEEGVVRNLFQHPNHPYTWGLLGSLPRLHQDVERLVQISGQPPSLLRPPSGCRFHPRCTYVMPICSQTEPTLDPVPEAVGDHRVRCHLDQETKDHEGASVIAGNLVELSR
jgi:peptide/nickel transport system ATP-binding protein